MSLKKILHEVYTGKADFPADFKCPKPEDMSCGIPYAITLNPKDQPNNLMRHADVVNFYDDLREVLSNLEGCYFHLVPELSVRARLHFHGRIQIYDKMMFFFHDLHKLNVYGNICIEPITDPTIWDLYIYKNREMVGEWLSFINCSHLGYYDWIHTTQL